MFAQLKPQRPLICAFLSFIAILTTITANDYSYAQFGDVEIYYNCSYWKCDQIVCPNDTDRCHVEKYKLKSEPTILVRENICYGLDNEVLAQRITNETIDPSANVRLKVDTYRSGFSSVQESYATNNVNSYASVDGVSIGNEAEREKFEKELEKKLNFEFVNFDKIGRDVEEKIRKVNEQIEDQLQDIRDQMENSLSTLHNLFWR